MGVWSADWQVILTGGSQAHLVLLAMLNSGHTFSLPTSVQGDLSTPDVLSSPCTPRVLFNTKIAKKKKKIN